jgi:hypothetical protein
MGLMQMADVIRQYYSIAEILNDDEHLIAYLIQKFHPKKIYFSAILSDIQNASVDRLDKFSDTLDVLNTMPKQKIIEEAKGLAFDTEYAYIQYLCNLLEVNGIIYVSNTNFKMKQKEEHKVKFETGRLF